ncbi:hypothetical protein HY230_06355 [Candidatus Acetothermia bacterium]|nr:hypothetical protein [Candidatus Acetothermia bacterium]
MNRTATLKKISKHIESLSDEELAKLLTIIEKLNEEDRRCLKYFGMWVGRRDMKDSVKSVRKLRDEQRAV